MAKVKVFVHASNADADTDTDADVNADTRAMTLAPRTFVLARLKDRRAQTDRQRTKWFLCGTLLCWHHKKLAEAQPFTQLLPIIFPKLKEDINKIDKDGWPDC